MTSSDWMKAHESDIEWLMFHCNDDRAIAHSEWIEISQPGNDEPTAEIVLPVAQPVDADATGIVIVR